MLNWNNWIGWETLYCFQTANWSAMRSYLIWRDEEAMLPERRLLYHQQEIEYCYQNFDSENLTLRFRFVINGYLVSSEEITLSSETSSYYQCIIHRSKFNGFCPLVEPANRGYCIVYPGLALCLMYFFRPLEIYNCFKCIIWRLNWCCLVVQPKWRNRLYFPAFQVLRIIFYCLFSRSLVRCKNRPPILLFIEGLIQPRRG